MHRQRRTSPLQTVHVRHQVPAGRRHVGIIGVELVGNYALRVQFDDLHSSAIFSWEFLRELGANKFTRMRAYITALRQQGGHRGPLLRK